MSRWAKMLPVFHVDQLNEPRKTRLFLQYIYTPRFITTKKGRKSTRLRTYAHEKMNVVQEASFHLWAFFPRIFLAEMRAGFG
jgi:hypothetical protein